MFTIKRFLCFALSLLFLLFSSSCKSTAGGKNTGVGGSTKREAFESAEVQFAPIPEGSLTATFSTSKGDIHVVLYPQYARLAVENFTALVQNGYYNDTIFHRVIADFIIQGGDHTGTGESFISMWGHPFATESTDRLRHYTGALCTASKNNTPNNNCNQFYIVATPQNALDDNALQALRDAGLRDGVVDTYAKAGGLPHLDNIDTVFGQVCAGMDVVDAIASAKTGEDGRPSSDIKLLSVTLGSYAAQPEDSSKAA